MLQLLYKINIHAIHHVLLRNNPTKSSYNVLVTDIHTYTYLDNIASIYTYVPVVISTSLYKLLLLSDLQLKRAAKSAVGFDKLSTLYIYDMLFISCTITFPD